MDYMSRADLLRTAPALIEQITRARPKAEAAENIMAACRRISAMGSQER